MYKNWLYKIFKIQPTKGLNKQPNGLEKAKNKDGQRCLPWSGRQSASGMHAQAQRGLAMHKNPASLAEPRVTARYACEMDKKSQIEAYYNFVNLIHQDF